MMVLKVDAISGGYEGKKIIEDVSFEIEAGEIVGLIGANGAGKTTLIKSILGILPLMSGTIELEGVDLKEDYDAIKGKLAYVPEIPMLYDELTLQEHLEFTAMANKISEQLYKERRNQLLEIFQMQDKLQHFPNSFSKGMKQKVMIMCMLLLRPSLLIFDEPFIGLDPKATKSLIDIMLKKRQDNVGIIMSTHVLDSAERICDRFLIVNSGQLIFNGTLQQLRLRTKMENGSLLDMYDRLVEAV